jgi:ring-1,2-phenylacetyl-CoA epoxidase subunit PaaC
LGTEESHRRMQAALDALWAFVPGVFVPLPDEARLADAGITPDPNLVREQWEAQVRAYLKESGLSVPVFPAGNTFSRFKHTADLASLLADLQQVARLDPDARW